MTKNKRKIQLIAFLLIVLLFVTSIIAGLLFSKKTIQTSTIETDVVSGEVKEKATTVDELYDQLSNSKTTNLVSEKYLVKDNTISRIRPETTVKEFKSEWENEIVTIYKDGSEVQDGIIETGMILKRGQEEYKLIVLGDIKQDGKADQIDANTIIKEIMEKGTEEIQISDANDFDEMQKLAADITEDKKINKGDIQKIADNIVFGKMDIAPVELVKSPKLEIVSGTLGENNWYQTEVQVRVKVQNELEKTAKTLYKIEGSSTQDFREVQNEEIIRLDGEGAAYKIIAYTIDNNGIKSQTTELSLKIDSSDIVSTITYSPENPGNSKVGQDVVAKISFNKEDVVITNNESSTTHTFKTNGQFTFEFKDKTGKTGTAVANVTWIGERIGADQQWQYLVLENGKIQLTRYIGNTQSITVPAQYDGYTVYSIGNPDFDASKTETRYNCIGKTNSITNTTITSLTFNEGIELIKGGAFCDCTGLTGNLVIPNSVKTIDTFAFWRCSSLTGELRIPEGVETIGYASFAECKNLNGTLTLPNSLKSIGQKAFGNCSHLTGDLVIPDGITRIENGTFSNCAGFNGTLKLPSNLTYIDDLAFQYCRNLHGQLDIPNTVTYIGNYAFNNCEDFSGTLVLPSSLNSLGDFAFRFCKTFTGDLTLPNSLTTLGKRAFDTCSGLTGNLTIPCTLTSVGDTPFSNTGFTKRITLIPSTVSSIDVKSIYDFSNVNEFKVEDGNTTFGDENGILYSKDFTVLYAVPVKLSESVTLHDGLLTIKAGAFSGEGRNQQITIPSSVTEIEEGAIKELETLGKDKVTFENECVYQFNENKITRKN